MIDIQIYVEYGDVLSLMREQKFQEALDVITTKFTDDIAFDKLMHLFLLQAYCHYKHEEYPLAINALGKILKHRYNSGIEHHLLAEGFYLFGSVQIDHSKGRNKTKNRSTFVAISSCMNLLCYREETLALMDRFLELVGEK